jgi:hypothetical protein
LMENSPRAPLVQGSSLVTCFFTIFGETGRREDGETGRRGDGGSHKSRFSYLHILIKSSRASKLLILGSLFKQGLQVVGGRVLLRGYLFNHKLLAKPAPTFAPTFAPAFAPQTLKNTLKNDEAMLLPTFRTLDWHNRFLRD